MEAGGYRVTGTYQLVPGSHSRITKNGQEPECGHETAMFSGRTIDVLRLLQLIKVERAVDGPLGGHDEYRFAASFTKVVCAA